MNLGEVWVSPDHFPIRVDPWGNTVVFVPVTRQMYRDLAFLDDRYIPMSESWEAPLDEVIGMAPEVTARPVHVLFHVAFCGSTLISRCLDRVADALVLKEPFPLHHLAFLKRHDPLMCQRPEAWKRAFDLVMRLLGRTYTARQVSIVKPSDASTHLLGAVLAHGSSAALFLYSDLDEFLPAFLSDPMRRRFARDRLDDLRVLFPDQPHLRAENVKALSDPEAVASLWLLHAAIYTEFVSQHPDASCRSLNISSFLAHPGPVLGEVIRFLGIDSSPGEIDGAIRAEMATHSKERDRAFTEDNRAASLRAATEAYGPEIRVGLEWAERARADMGLPRTMPRALETT